MSYYPWFLLIGLGLTLIIGLWLYFCFWVLKEEDESESNIDRNFDYTGKHQIIEDVPKPKWNTRREGDRQP